MAHEYEAKADANCVNATVFTGRISVNIRVTAHGINNREINIRAMLRQFPMSKHPAIAAAVRPQCSSPAPPRC
jgi:hypothetical protein